jgi:hypothetical protein
MKKKTLPIETPREYRLIKSISKKSETLHDLKPIVGSENVAEVKRQLILKGWDIETERFTMVDRDSNRTRPGRYILPVHMKEIAKNSLAAYAKAANDDSFKSDGEKNHE